MLTAAQATVSSRPY